MSQMVQSLALAALRLHPRNEEFFSNAEGEDFKRLKESIAEQGILTPLRVSADMVIVSGHQRYRAAQELGLVKVPVIVDDNLLDEDEKLVQLIASNFGRMKNDPVKQGRWIKEYERLRGISHGGSRRHNVALISQEDIAKELGVDVRTIQRLKSLNTLLPELQEIISEGRINATTGFKLIARLSEDEQRQLLETLETLPEAQKLTQKQVQTYIDQIQGYETQITKLSVEKEELQKEAAEATKAAKSAHDSNAYLKMKQEKEAAEEKYRLEYEARQKLINNTKAANTRTAEEIRKLEARLAEAERKANAKPEEIEVEVEKEVYPEDYEDLKYKASEYDRLIKKITKNRSVDGINTAEEEQHNFVMFFQNSVEGFAVEIDSILANNRGLASLEPDRAFQFVNTIKRIVGTCEELQNYLNTKVEVA